MTDTRRPTILVIDDSDICLELVADALEQAGYQVETSNKALGASKLITDLRPDVVVVDIGMPALDGASLVQIIQRNRYRGCAVLLHTDRDRAELDATIASSGAHGGALKSADSSELIAEIRRVFWLRGVHT